MSRKQTALAYDYGRMEAMVSGFVPQWRQMNFDAVVAIARGGLFPGLVASTELSIPLHALSYVRENRAVSWYTQSHPKPASRLLLVEDIAGRGTTLSDSRQYLVGFGHDVSVFTLVYDADSRIKPDFGTEVPAGFRAWLPWERTSISPAFAASGNQPGRREHEYASWAIDLDGVLLMDLPEHRYAEALHETLAERDLLLPSEILPGLDLADITIITGRPEQDRLRTQKWLSSHGFHGALIMRDETRHTAGQTPEHKAQAILAGCHTHFIESDPVQALEIARRTRLARVIWWNGGKAIAVYANDIEHLRLA